MALKYSLTTLAVLAALPAAAEETIGDAVSIELNTAKTSESACTLSFVVVNGYAAPFREVIYETVLFDPAGQVERLTLFNMGALPPARQRVRQFSVPGVTCEGLSSILFNGASTCTGEGLPESACEVGLMLSTRTDIEMKG